MAHKLWRTLESLRINVEFLHRKGPIVNLYGVHHLCTGSRSSKFMLKIELNFLLINKILAICKRKFVVD